jgi:hypothetical protein
LAARVEDSLANAVALDELKMQQFWRALEAAAKLRRDAIALGITRVQSEVRSTRERQE